MNQSDHSALRTPGCTDRLKAAFTVGAVVGITIGGLYGGSQAFRYVETLGFLFLYNFLSQF